MLLKLLKTEKANQVGMALADALVLETASRPARARAETRRPEFNERALPGILQRFLQRVDREARPLQLNVLKRAVLANSFKWRLIEQGVERQMADELTQALVVRLSTTTAAQVVAARSVDTTERTRELHNAPTAFARGTACLARRAYAEAIEHLQEVLRADAEHVAARSNLGAALCGLGRYQEAEAQFRRAIAIRRDYADAHSNLGTVLRLRGELVESEATLREALKLKPSHVEAQLNLSLTLLLLGRWREAKALLENVLKRGPGNVAALVGLAQIAGPEGRFAQAESLFKRAIEIDPQSPGAWAGLVWLRKMTPADRAWLERAEQISGVGLAPHEEANIRYAIGKYHDDLGDFKSAFHSYRRANELQKMAAEPYDRSWRARFVEDMQRTYTRATLTGSHPGASDSVRPVFVVGMPRSGTSMVEQILASHPAVSGAGEFGYWSGAMRQHEGAIRQEFPGEPLRRKLAAGYLRALGARCSESTRVIDKTPFNADYLGLIHTVFPRARIIYLRRSPIDTCLSCYFQQFSTDMSFAMDLSDLAHYYREHARLVAHWHDVLPAGTLLDVSYEDLIADQEGGTRRILAFLGLDWDERCLNFHKTERAVMTASFWQVRQEIYRRSGGRWHNYKKYIGPLLSLNDVDS